MNIKNLSNTFNLPWGYTLYENKLEKINDESIIFSLNSQLNARILTKKNSLILRNGFFTRISLLKYCNFYNNLYQQGFAFPKPTGIFNIWNNMDNKFYPGLVTSKSPEGIDLTELKNSSEQLIFPMYPIFEDFEENIQNMKEFGYNNQDVFFDCAKYCVSDEKIYFDFYGDLKDLIF